MGVNMKGKSLLTLLDYSKEDIKYLLDLSEDFKRMKKEGIPHRYLEGKNVALIFEKTSTRTRCSFEVASFDLGMGVTYLGPGNSQMGAKESISDTARVLGRFYDGIEYRGFSQETVEILAKDSGVPVWNGLTDQFHPTQMLADLMTIEENFGRLEGMNLVFMGDGRNNVANSLMVACAKMGVNYTVCAPRELFPSDDLVVKVKEIARESGSSVTLTDNIEEGTKGAHAIYTDIWVSMGESEEVWETRIRLLKPFQVTRAVMYNADPDAIFLHCLPSFHDLNTKIGKKISEKYGITEMEVADEVFSSRQSKVFDEAENRMHTIKAVMYATLC